MKKLAFAFFVVFVFTSFVVNGVHASRDHRLQNQNYPSLRIDDPLEEVVADLEAFIPDYMSQEEVPGVGIALIREGQVVWSDGYGISSLLTKTPVLSETTFQLASNSKVVTAYIALRLVDQGLLSLDEPLGNYLDEPYISQEEFRSVITLRHTLSHTSGMGHDGISHKVRFQPGAGYSYSANGFLYTQKVLEEITGKPLDQLAQELVFEPLEMQNSSFVDSPVVIDNASSGHFPAMALLIVFLFTVSVIFLIFWLLVLIVWRIKNGDWRMSRRVTVMVYIASVISVTILVSIMTGGIKPYHIFLIVFTCGALILLMWFADRVLRLIARDRLRLKNLLLVVFFIIIVIGFIAIASIIGDIPNPPVTNVKPSAAGTLRSTAVDMGKFLIELAEPHLLSPDQADQIRSPQVSLSSDLSWGLGPGIQHSQDGDALWQWGQTLDFQSVMIIYPDLGFGVVVLTNSDLLNPDVAIDIAHRAIGGKIEGIIGGSHLQFNYQGPFIE